MSLSVNTLFGNMGNSTSAGSFNSGLYASLSEYTSIRTGAYKKLLNAYYTKDNSSSSNTVAANKKPVNSVAENKQLAVVKNAADDLYSSSAKLTDTSASKSLFKKADSVTNDIVSAVKSYVSDYNTLVEEAADTSNKKVTGKVSFMTSQTSAYRNALSEIGITINDDKTLTVDDKALKNADISKVKSLFNGSDSMAYQTFVRASAISSAAENAGNTSSIYGSDGTYSSYYSSAYNWYL